MTSESPIQRKIVIALDSSQSSSACFNWTLQQILNPRTDKVNLIHIVSSAEVRKQVPLTSILSPSQWSKSTEDSERNAFKLLSHFANVLDNYNIRHDMTIIKGSSTVDQLVEHVKMIKPDLLVMGKDMNKSVFQR
jgi:nucleotide-binding universal stress UspA family protein